METAFQSNAFQINAFQVVAPVTLGGKEPLVIDAMEMTAVDVRIIPLDYEITFKDK